MKEFLELVDKKIELENTLKNLNENSTVIIQQSLTQKFNLLGRMLLPYKEILKQIDEAYEVIRIYSQQLDREISIKIYPKKENHWLEICFNSCSDNSLFNIERIDKTYWIKYPVLQEINLQLVVDEFRKSITSVIKRKNKNLEIEIKQIKQSLNACNIEADVKIFEAMLNDLFELNNQYITSKDENLIPFISNIITAMEETLTFKE